MNPMALTAISLQADLQKINVTANNSANALTPGFKRELVAVATALDGGAALTAESAQEPYNPLQLRVVTDSSAGVPRQTGNALDFAVLGNGYFEVQTPNGVAYTRQGAFRLDAQGRLVTEAGYAVSGIDGEILFKTSTPTVDQEGRATEAGKAVGQLKVVVFDPAAAPLKSAGGGLLLAGESQRPTISEHPRVAQGQLESSNVNSSREMVNLMETYRHFESASRVLQAYDDLSDKTFRALGQF